MFSINSSSILVPVLLVGVIVSASNVCALTAHAQTTTVKEVLAPTGKLRVGVYPGSPTSMVKAANTGEIHGIAFDLGRELARQLGVPFEPVTYLRVDEILKEMMAGQLDFTVTNATPVRAKDLDFSHPAFHRAWLSRAAKFCRPRNRRHRPSHYADRRNARKHISAHAPKVVEARLRRSCFQPKGGGADD